MGTFLILLIVLVLAMVASSYNALQKLSQNVKEKASNVQVAISKKLTLINQLIDIVKNYQEGEQFVHLKIAQDTNAASMLNSYQQSGTVLSTIQGLAERFPNLKSSDQYHRLMDNITDCEANIQANREKYNQTVKEYNSKRSGIPTVFVAQFIGFSEAPYLQFDMTGNDSTSLKEFKTDDGERLRSMLKNAGSNIAGATKTISSHAVNATKLISERLIAKPSDSFFYLSENGIPKGPKSLAQIKSMIDEGLLPAETKIALVGSDDWHDIHAYEAV